jgi:uncharacterized membrane protein
MIAPVPAGIPTRSAASGAAAATARSRAPSIDLVRGGVMVLMALDHVRAFFTAARFEATDLAATSPALFLTRWITHYCASAFILLAGVSAALAGRRRTPDELSRFLFSRGAWLVLLEVTVVSFGWYFNLSFAMGAFAQVIWAIGVSMMVLAGLVRLPRGIVAAIAGAMIGGHNLLDGVAPAAFGALAPVWTALHVPGALGALPVFVAYPVIPWIGVMAAGYLLGPVFDAPAVERRRLLLRLGGAATVGFLVLRGLNVYGDPAPWSAQADVTMTVLSFLNTTKYPPSLLYLLMTLGPTLLALGLLERAGTGAPGRWIATFGRVPLFYYVAHLYLVHLLAMLAAVARGYPAADLADVYLFRPDGFGFGLPVIYAVTLAVVALLYPLSRRYDEVKRRGKGWWWSYL